MTRLARLKHAIPLIAAAGDTVVLAHAPAGMSSVPGTLVAVTAHGYAAVSPEDIDTDLAPGPYDDFADADLARREGRFQLRPFRPEHLLRDLVDQLKAIGIPDWHGAEGLSTEDAEAFLAGDGIARLRDARARSRALAAVGWDEHDAPYSDWQDEVRNGDTRIGYAEFVLREREGETDDEISGASVMPNQV